MGRWFDGVGCWMLDVGEFSYEVDGIGRWNVRKERKGMCDSVGLKLW